MHVLSVSSLKGGVGKTTVTLGLASAAFSRGLRTLVVDFDPQSDVSTGMDIQPAGHLNISDVLESPKERIVRAAIAHSGWSKAVEGSTVKTVKPTGEGLFRAKSRPVVVRCRMQARGATNNGLHLVTQSLKLLLRKKVLQHHKTIPLEVGQLGWSQQASPEAKHLRQLNTVSMQLPTFVQTRVSNPRILKALGTRQQRKHGRDITR